MDFFLKALVLVLKIQQFKMVSLSKNHCYAQLPEALICVNISDGEKPIDWIYMVKLLLQIYDVNSKDVPSILCR